ncbi:unnamed protein product [Phyllotreta striolata]|uniref:Phospholipid/glycerol acyltransferase domain-containing protein n=1 Tax=Phyllotreta striolata TaxID=444603 RepID=A0A9N9TU47_PHYSR|nr:unnamed protein product [Phyllotreta striolata]
MSIVREYDNFLELRKQETSNFLWISKKWNPQIAFKQGSTRPSPQYHKDAVLNSPKIQDLLEQISLKTNVPKVELEHQVKDILDEIGYEKKLKVIRWLGLILTKICLTVLSGIYVNVEQVEQIKNQMGNCPVIFVPTHRSYGDFIMMSYLSFQYDIEIPAIAAGMDFFGMWGMGTLLRDTGAFFMRRSYNDDSLYWTTFKQYIYQLVSKGDLPIEFFIEGTRSRSNKSLTPKYGLLTMVLKPFFFSQVPDIQFVPIGFSYDRILEESLFAFELLGVPKPKETTSGFFKSMKILKENFGNIYIHMDKPISAKEFFGSKLDRSVHNLTPLHKQEVTEDEKTLLPPLAYEILNRQQKVLVTTVFNLVSLVLNNNLAYETELLSMEELACDVKWIREILRSLGGFTHTTNIERSIDDCLKTHKNLVYLNRKGKLKLVRNPISQGEINHKKLKGHYLSDDTMTYSVPFVTLQIYINPILHYFIDIDIILVILDTRPMNEDELFESYCFLRCLFSREFITFAPKDKTAFNAAMNDAISLNLVNLNNGKYQLANNKKLGMLIVNTFYTFYVSFFATLLILERLPSVVDEKSILANVQKLLEDAIVDKHKEFIHPYSLNLDTLANCLNSLVDEKVLQKTRRDNVNAYEINKIKLKDVKDNFARYMTRCSIEERCQIINKIHLQNKL